MAKKSAAEKDAPPIDPVSTTNKKDIAASSEGAGKNPPAFPTYEVIAPLRHDGRRYAPGDLVALAPELAARLIGLRVVELIEA